MKRKALLLVMFVMAATAMTLTSCSKDPEELLVGKWGITSAVASMGSQTYDLTSQFNGLVFEFKEDGTMNGYLNGEISDNNGTWSYADDKLTITSDGESMAFDVEELTKSVLKISGTYEGTYMSLSFKKQ